MFYTNKNYYLKLLFIIACYILGISSCEVVDITSSGLCSDSDMDEILLEVQNFKSTLGYVEEVDNRYFFTDNENERIAFKVDIIYDRIETTLQAPIIKPSFSFFSMAYAAPGPLVYTNDRFSKVVAFNLENEDITSQFQVVNPNSELILDLDDIVNENIYEHFPYDFFFIVNKENKFPDQFVLQFSLEDGRSIDLSCTINK